MPPDIDARFKALLLVMLIIVIGLIGIFLILGILASWRNYFGREQISREDQANRNQGTLFDGWGESGRRFGTDAAGHQGEPSSTEHPSEGSEGFTNTQSPPDETEEDPDDPYGLFRNYNEAYGDEEDEDDEDDNEDDDRFFPT